MFRITQSKVQLQAIVNKAGEREVAANGIDWVKLELEPLQKALDDLLKNFETNDSLLQQLGDLVHGFVRDEDMTFTEQSFLNMSVTGRAGVGKTFFAEHLAEFMGALGVLVFNEYVSVSRADLVGQYVGQTAPLVRSVFTRNLEKVVFLDEAYSLTTYTEDPVDKNKGRRILDSFSGEAVTELLTILNNLRGKMSLVVAGYAGKINDDFFAANEGLRRRFTYFFDLPDYTPEELFGIYKRTLNNILKMDRLKPSAEEYFMKLVKEVKRAYKEDEERIENELFADDDDGKSVADSIISSSSDSASTAAVEKLTEVLKPKSNQNRRENKYKLIYDFFNQQGGAAVQLAQATNLMLKAYAKKEDVVTDQTIFGIIATRLAERHGIEEEKEQILKQLTELTATIVDDSAGRLEGKAWGVWQEGVSWAGKAKNEDAAGGKRKAEASPV
jgi:SpoVK/Ycf46/Vps4 family AAA+-type ATPase